MHDVRIQITRQCPWCAGKRSFPAPWDEQQIVACDHCTDGRVPGEITLAELSELLQKAETAG